MTPKHCSELILLCVLSVSNAGRLNLNTVQETTTEDFSIVGGQAVDIKEVPYQVSVQIYGSHYCGGSIIATNIILTASHCLIHPVDLYQVRAGSSLNYTGGTVVKVNKIKSHPDGKCDIGVMWLTQNLQFGATIKKVELANQGVELPPETKMLVTGWGALQSQGPAPSDSLQKVTVPIVSRPVCNKAYQGIITTNMICAGYTEGGKDSCQGDSGGPLVYNNVQYGIVSFGTGCALPNYPGVYANVGSLRNWIDHTIKQ